MTNSERFNGSTAPGIFNALKELRELNGNANALSFENGMELVVKLAEMGFITIHHGTIEPAATDKSSVNSGTYLRSDGAYLYLCDEDGVIYDGQGDLSVKSNSDEVTEATVTFTISGTVKG